jgi:hypothetical protein
VTENGGVAMATSSALWNLRTKETKIGISNNFCDAERNELDAKIGKFSNQWSH